MRGRQPATFSASDNTGIRAGRIYVDGELTATATYGCDFTYAVPCSNRSDAQVELDTRTLSDGAHSIQVAAVDPAGNETRSAPRDVVVDNGAPSTPQGLFVDGGPDWRDFNSFDVAWTNPGDPGSPVSSAHYAVCATDGSGCFAEQEANGTNVNRISGISVPSPGAWALRVWLEDAAGNVDPANVAELTLRYGSSPSAETTPQPQPPSIPAPARDPSPVLTDLLGPPSLETPAVIPPRTSTVRVNPRLRLTSARLDRRRLVVRGRSAGKLALTLTIRLRNGRSVHRHATVRRGSFKLVIRSRRPIRASSVVARFAGSPRLLPARSTLRLRG